MVQKIRNNQLQYALLLKDWCLWRQIPKPRQQTSEEPQALTEARAGRNRKIKVGFGQVTVSTVFYVLVTTGLMPTEVREALEPLGGINLLMLASNVIEAQLKVQDLEEQEKL